MNTTETRTDSAIRAAIRAAKLGRMTANEWTGPNETRIYLKRTNAARTEAGYIRLFEEDGKFKSRLVITARGTGSRTAASEAESVYFEYKAFRAEIMAEKTKTNA